MSLWLVAGRVPGFIMNLMKKIYRQWIEPRSKDPDQRNRELVLNWLMTGTICLIAVQFVNLLASLSIRHKGHVLPRIFVLGLLLSGFVALFIYTRRYGRLIYAKFALLAMFTVFTFYVLYQWSILNPVGILLGALTIVMASILFRARYSLFTAIALGLILSFVEIAKARGYIEPDVSWMQKPSTFTDVASFTTIFFLIALITWLFNRQMEMSLHRARRSERALRRQSELLEKKVEERTRELQVAQIEKIQQFYRFAELGHLSTALFHDLADPLMSVSLDIEGLKKNNRSQILGRIQDNINYVDNVVQRVRYQIQGKSQIERFNVSSEIKKVMKLLNSMAVEAGVKMELSLDNPSRPLFYAADIIRFRQVITNLLSNGIEAYKNREQGAKGPHRLYVNLESNERNITIKITDYGAGIPISEQTRIFEPFYSTKERGSGIGLFIVKQIIEQDFHGSLKLRSSRQKGTVFSVILPKNYVAKK
jgi:signal transduction histidine kinase